ncbi:MAG: GIY-YIG nuclease family protein [Candidatus Omnitrophica bacterium]|nr:GIY-YIG nuclease family protein [Candidatus Omnitrophota bacterium]
MPKKRGPRASKTVSPKPKRSTTLKRHSQYFVYIVECATGTYYTGYTKDIDKRIKLHNSGHGAKYLRGKLPVTLVFKKEYKYYKNALTAEREVKKLSRKQKEQLVAEGSPRT